MVVRDQRYMFGSLCLSSVVVSVLGIPTISTKGSKFFTSDGNQFYIKGVVYRNFWDDELSLFGNGAQCKRDAQAMKKLGANAVRVVTTNTTDNNDDCMRAFEDAGIYVLIDLSTLDQGITAGWSKALQDKLASTMDTFQKYDNLLGFNIGFNFVIDIDNNVLALYFKAAIVDMKGYRDLMQYRTIPIGYSTSYDPRSNETRRAQQAFFTCGDNTTAADFFALNQHTWCDEFNPTADFITSNYSQVYDDAAGYNIPIFFSENGCSRAEEVPRRFLDQPVIFGDRMGDRWSGNFIYQWQETSADGRGLVEYKGDDIAGEPRPLEDYENLRSQWATVTPTGVQSSEYTPTSTSKITCPTLNDGWWINSDAQLPTIGWAHRTFPTASRTTGEALPGQTTNSRGPDSTGARIGGIVGGVLGGLAFSLLIGAWWFTRWLKRRRAATVGNNGESDKMAVDAAEYHTGSYGPQEIVEDAPKYHTDFHGPQEMANDPVKSELDPAKGNIAALKANELPPGRNMSEMREPTSPTEIKRGTSSASPTVEGTALSATHQAPSQERSPFVDAQRRLEMEWLENEEARMRQRREVLRNQQQHGGNGFEQGR